MPGTGGRSHRPASLCSRHQAVPACRTDMRRWRCAGASMWRRRGGRVADVHFPCMGVVLALQEGTCDKTPFGVPGVISGNFSVGEIATKSLLVARHDYI